MVAVAGLLLSPLSAIGQTTTPAGEAQATFSPMTPEPEGLSLTPFLGVGFAGDYENTPPTFGAALGYGVSPRVSFEAELFFAPGGEQGALAQFDTRTWSLGGNMLYHFLAEDFTPYVTGGIGIIGAFTDAAATGLTTDENEHAFAWNWGGGVKTALSERVGLRADLRYINADELTPDHWRLYGGVVFRRLGR
jgi:opacity protein-like surface antigen